MADTGEEGDARKANIRIMKQAAKLKLLPFQFDTLTAYFSLKIKTSEELVHLWGVYMLLLHEHSVTAEEALE